MPTNEVAARRKPRKERVRETFEIQIVDLGGPTLSMCYPLEFWKDEYWARVQPGQKVRVTVEPVERKGGKG